jgi:hypothetical protein
VKPHAWIEHDGIVWDPVSDEHTPEVDYPGHADARYTRTEALRLAMGRKHCGPWHEPAQTMGYIARLIGDAPIGFNQVQHVTAVGFVTDTGQLSALNVVRAVTIESGASSCCSIGHVGTYGVPRQV